MTTYRAQIPGTTPLLAQASFVEMFYDTHARVWTVTLRDGHYNQLGEADYALGCCGFKSAAKHAEDVVGKGKLKFEKI